MRLEDFWINSHDELPTELECSLCYATVGEIERGAKLAAVVAMAGRHLCVPVVDGEVVAQTLAIAR